MSNLSFSGFDYHNELNSEFKLRNLIETVDGETQTISMSLLNSDDSGYGLMSLTVHGSTPILELTKQQADSVETILTIDSEATIRTISLNNIYKITDSVDPTEDQDLVTKKYLNDAISDKGYGSVVSVSVSSITEGLISVGSPITTSGNIELALSENLVALSQLASTGLFYRTNNDLLTTSEIPVENGKVLSSLNGVPNWITPIDSDSVTSVGAIARWNDEAGRFLKNSSLIVDENENLNISGKRIVNSAPPEDSTDLVTRGFVETALSEIGGGAPIGAIIMWASETLPDGGWFECDGAELSRTLYADLFSVIETHWGEGDGSTTFNLPDCRGMFPRGWNHGKSTGMFDPDAANRTPSNTGGATGDQVGTVQEEEIKSHDHTYQKTTNATTVNGIGSVYVRQGINDNALTATVGGNETRPSNFSVMFIIKAWQPV